MSKQPAKLQGMTHNNAAYNYGRNPVSLAKPKRTGVTITKAESHVDASDMGAVEALHKLTAERTDRGFIRVIKPGDAGYDVKRQIMYED